MAVHIWPYEYTKRSDQPTGIAGLPNREDFDNYTMNFLLNSQLSGAMINFLIKLQNEVHAPNNWVKRTEPLHLLLTDEEDMACYLGGMLTRGSARRGRTPTKNENDAFEYEAHDYRTTLFDEFGNLENVQIVEWLQPIINNLPHNAYAASRPHHILPSAVLRWPAYSFLLDITTNNPYHQNDSNHPTYLNYLSLGKPKKWVVDELLSLALIIPIKGIKTGIPGRPATTHKATSWGQRLIEITQDDPKYQIDNAIRQAARQPITPSTPTTRTNTKYVRNPHPRFQTTYVNGKLTVIPTHPTPPPSTSPPPNPNNATSE